MGVKYFCDNCKKETSDSELVIKGIPVVETVFAMGGNRGQQRVLRWDKTLEFEELALCETCQDKYQEAWDYGMKVIAQLWGEIKSK